MLRLRPIAYVTAALSLSALTLVGCAPADAVEGAAPTAAAPAAPHALDEEPGDPVEPTATELAEAAERFERVGLYRQAPPNDRVAYNTVTDAQATEWELRNSAGTSAAVGSGAALALRNTYDGNYLKYGSRSYGINLVWSSTPSYTVSFRTATGAAPRYGDLVALSVSGGGYVRYGSRSYGINLVWSSTPVYEWRLLGGTTGAAVYTKAPLRLFNTVEASRRGDNMVYCRRTWGINLTWARDCSVVPLLGRYRTEDVPGI
jgi:hypothetical protein